MMDGLYLQENLTGMKHFTIFLLAIMISLAALAQQTVTIYEIQGQQESSPFEGQIITTTGIVTGVFGPGYFIQDGEGEWNGVYVYSNDNVARGDEVTITGKVIEYYDLTEINEISNFQLISTGNALPEPAVLGTWDVNDESWEGVLVRVEQAICTNTNLGYGEWELDDGSGPCRVDDLGIVYSPDPGLSYAVTGNLYYSFEDYKIEPRDENDIQILETVYFTMEPDQGNLSKTGFSLTWETNVEATTELYYGTTTNLELGHLTIAGTTTSHTIEITGLQAGTVYYVRPFSVAAPDTTAFYMMPYATVSNSGGAIRVIFNHNVDTSGAIEEPAVWTRDITDTVISFISQAQQTLDITMYEQESEAIVNAINAAYERDVQIRYITDDIGTNPALQYLNENIPVLYGNTEAIMHNKFIIADVASEMNCQVMTGSLNHTENNLGWDYNNVIVLQDQSLARAFTMEFEEMWGSDGPMYDESNARFGAEKTNNTPHKFLIGEIPVELYFSPSDATTSEIARIIDNAAGSLEFGVMVFTENTLGNAVLAAHQRGVETRGIIDYVEFSGSEYDYLKNNGVDVRDYVNPDGTSWPDGPVFHHKYMIADFHENAEHPVLVTGSHNWSASAESINDENTLVIHDLNLANQFHQEFSKRYNDQITPIAMDDDTITPLNMPVQIACLENDFIPEDIFIAKNIIDGPYYGLATWNSNFIDYTPDENFTGHDSLRYTISNIENALLEDTAWAFIKVGNVGIEDRFHNGFSLSAFQGEGSMLITVSLNSPEDASANIQVFDQLGRKVAGCQKHVCSGKNRFNVNLTGKRPGFYFVEVRTNAFRKIQKVQVAY